MNKFFDKVRAVLNLVQGYCLRVVKCMNVIGAMLNMLHAESYEAEEEAMKILNEAMNSLGEVEKVIKELKDIIKGK